MASNRRGLQSRKRILEVAVRMFEEDPAAALSVRSVAAAAGVSAGSLRYAFPTQRELQDAVLTHLADAAFTDDGIGDRSIPPRERLLACMQHLLAAVGTGSSARSAWTALFRAFIEPEPTPALIAAQRSVDAATHTRVERWLMVLRDEGSLVDEDTAGRARFLCTILNGLAFERALPSAASTLATEAHVLRAAVAAVAIDGPAEDAPRPR